MKKKKLIPLLVMNFALLVCSCGNNTSYSKSNSDTSKSSQSTSIKTSTSTTSKVKTIDECEPPKLVRDYAEKNYQPILQDYNFKKGFKISKLKNISGEDPHHSEKINFYDKYKSDAPTWTMAQWGSRFDLLSEDYRYSLERSANGLTNTIIGKSDGLLPSKMAKFNSETGLIELTLNASEEYLHPRTSNEDWPSLLLSQSLKDSELVKLSSITSLVVDTSYVVTKCENKMGSDYVESRHTAQLVLFLTVQNRTRGHVDYGKYIWFGFNLFDYRYQGKEFTFGPQHDKGTGRMIYKTSSKDTMKDTNGLIPIVNQNGHCQFDMLDEAKKALDKGKELNYFTDKTTWNDMYIGGFNFGFENPGTFDISATINNINFFFK